MRYNINGYDGTSYRKEQLRAIKILRKFFDPKDIFVEYELNKLTIDNEPAKPCTLDIAIISGENKLAIRLNGEDHFNSAKQMDKDGWQKIALEQNGWRVVDFNKDEMPILWKYDDISDDMIEEVMSKICI